MEYLKNRLQAFKYAFSGIRNAFKNEVHLKLFFIIAFLVIGLGFCLNISRSEWINVLLCITLVLVLEMFNSALEKLCDLIIPEQNPKIKYIKDVMAGAVLIACLFAFITGLAIFLPYINKNF